VGAEAQENALLSKQYPTADVVADTKEIVRKPDNSKQSPSPDLLENVVAPQLAKPANFRRKSNILSVAVCALVIPSLFATVSLPAYGATVGGQSDAVAPTAPGSGATQSLSVDGATVQADALQRAKVKYVAPRPRAHYSRVHFPSVNLHGIAGIAARYLGVPYKFGGESPAGFDCSGLVEYVYAKVGIHLPHSAAQQGRMGHRVARGAARSGDVVVMDGGSHVGIYIGGDKMIDAPEPGRRVSVDKIYDNDYYFVRF
jgi:cell wall-associated NlpC family hydrolase